MTAKTAPCEVKIVHPDYQPSKAEREPWSLRLARWSDVGDQLAVPAHRPCS